MEEKTVSLKKNYIYNTIYQLLILVTPFITSPYTSRIFQADGIGIQSYVNSVVSYFTLFAALGTSVYGQREIAAARDDKKKRSKLFWEIEIVSLLATFVCLVGWLLLILMTDTYRPYYIALTMSIFAVGFDITWFFNGLEKFKTTVIRSIIVRLVGVAVLFIFVRKKSDLLLYIALLAATGMVGNISLWLGLRKYLCKIRLSELEIKHHFKEVIVYFVPTIAMSIYTILDKIMIGIITGNSYENGYYEQAQKIITMVKTLILSLNTVMSSRMSYLFQSKRFDEMKEKIKISLDFSMILGIPMMFGVMGVARLFVPLFFGEGYDKVVPLLWILSPLIIITAISNLIGHQYMIPSGQRARSSKAVIAGACCNFAFNMALIPCFASMGAAVATVIAESVITVIYILMSGDFFTFRMLFRSIGKRMLAGIVMFGSVLFVGSFFDSGIFPLILQVCTGVVIYGAGLLLMRDSAVIDLLGKLIQKLKKSH